MSHNAKSENTVPAPGTQHLLSTAHATTNKARHNDIILIPQPSPSPSDPLNWCPNRKLLNTICYTLYVLCNGIAGSNLYSVETTLSSATGLSLSVINAGTGYLFLLAGWGLLFWQPFALQYGKRLTYILSLLATLAFTMWSPYVSSAGQWYARSVLLGFVSSPVEALPEISVTDLYFAHERGWYMGLYALTLVGSNFVSPLIFGFVNDRMGYRWVFHWTAIFCAVGVLVLFFFMEETNLVRRDVTAADEIEDATVLDEKRAGGARLQTLADWRARPKSAWRMSFKMLFPRPPSLHPKHLLPRLYLQLRFLLFPIPIYAGFAYGSTLIWFNVLNATSSLVLSSPPYNFAPSIVGLAYVASLLGAVIGFAIVGRFSDLLVLGLARRNGGIMQPEMRLWIFAASTVLIPTALLLWGVGSVHGIHWIGLLFAMGIFGFVNTCGASLGVNYLVDCYRGMAGSALSTVIIVRNTLSFAINYGITPWIDNLGRQDAFISAACIGAFVSLHFLVMIWVGYWLRRRSKDEYWSVLRWAKERGFAH